jgi:hypothetical protein
VLVPTEACDELRIVFAMPTFLNFSKIVALHVPTSGPQLCGGKAAAPANVWWGSFWPILLQKSFCADDQKF